MSKFNFALRTDGYKPSHWLFYDPSITQIYDYLESRGGMFGDVTFFGLQALLKKYFVGSVITPEQVDEADRFYKKYFGMSGVFNREGWMYIATTLKGHLPLEIAAIPEGTTVPVRTPMVAYWNTDPKCAWLVGYIEPLIFKVWNSITVCTLSRHCKKVLKDGLIESGTVSDLPWKLHDFGYRGVSSEESAEFAGAAHLVNFQGTDTIPAIQFIHDYYSDLIFDEFGSPEFMPGFSVRATEHSVMTQLGREREFDVVKMILEKCPTGIVAMVADSYDLWNFARRLTSDLHPLVIEREGVVVVRPDSGDPVPNMIKLLWELGEGGYDVNEKGFKVLRKIRTLQGDKNDYDAIYNMQRAVMGAGWSMDNIATFGMGGALLQASTRDTQNMAVKASSVVRDGVWYDVYKDPITDPGKYSKRGRFRVHSVIGPNGKPQWKTSELRQGDDPYKNNLLQQVFLDGKLTRWQTFQQIRRNAEV